MSRMSADGKKKSSERTFCREFVSNKLRLNNNNDGNGKIIAGNLVQLFEEENTIPFVARYRRHLTGDLEVGQLRLALRAYEEAKAVLNRSAFVESQLQKAGQLTDALRRALKTAESLDRVEAIYLPFKRDGKQTLAAKARGFGLQAPADDLFAGQFVNFGAFVKPNVKGLSSEADVRLGVQHIVADSIAKSTEAQDFIRDLPSRLKVVVEGVLAKKAETMDKAAREKYQNYFNFSSSARDIRAHQMLALNRGEAENVLKVKISIPDDGRQKFGRFCSNDSNRRVCGEHLAFFNSCIDDCYKRLVEPQMQRAVRSSLTKTAEQASADVFGENLKGLLMAPPVKNVFIIGLDPGFTHGCKTALISPTSVVLSTGVFRLKNGAGGQTNELFGRYRDLILETAGDGAVKLAIGNGTGCRDTEQLVSEMIGKGIFSPLRSVEYCIVNESGSSVYSVSDVAAKELPALDPNLRSAVSIARRLQDPLAELVKISPKSLGVGMYQHDLSNKVLQTSLDSVVEECVSFVGVDLNTCSVELLQHVAGLNRTRAQNIVEHRAKIGNFSNRSQLKDVKAVGAKSFTQCAGFVNIYLPQSSELLEKTAFVADGKSRKRKLAAQSAGPSTKSSKVCERNTIEQLDSTSIHPEDYCLSRRILEQVQSSTSYIGLEELRRRVEEHELELLSNAGDDSVKKQKIAFIIEQLKRPRNFDLRLAGERKPLFRRCATKFEDLKAGMELSGAVRNVTNFGAFIDVGVGVDGLLHSSRCRTNPPVIGQRVEVRIVEVDATRKRIGLALANERRCSAK